MHSSKTVTLTCGRVRRSADLLSGYVRIIGEPSKTSIYNNWSLRIEHFSVRPPLVRTSLLRQMSFKQHWLINCRNCNEISICRWSEFHEMNSLTSTGMRCVCNNFNSSFLFEFAFWKDSSNPKSIQTHWVDCIQLCANSSYICSCGMYSTRSRQSSYKSSRTTW